MTEIQALRPAREAFARRAWAESYRRFQEAGAEAPLGPEDLERLATSAYLIGHEAESEAFWARAHQTFLDRGDPEGAARSVAVAPKFVELTNHVVFGDLWRRSDLSLRDRSLVTIAALAATGDDDELDPYLRRGLETGLTRAEIVEALTHLGFYGGWSKATKAMKAVTRTLGR